MLLVPRQLASQNFEDVDRLDVFAAAGTMEEAAEYLDGVVAEPLVVEFRIDLIRAVLGDQGYSSLKLSGGFSPLERAEVGLDYAICLLYTSDAADE